LLALTLAGLAAILLGECLVYGNESQHHLHHPQQQHSTALPSDMVRSPDYSVQEQLMPFAA